MNFAYHYHFPAKTGIRHRTVAGRLDPGGDAADAFDDLIPIVEIAV